MWNGRNALFTLALAATAAGAQTTTITVAQVLATEGPAALTGQQIAQGTQVCIEAANAESGVKGRKLRLVTANDGDAKGVNAQQTVAQVKSLLDKESPVAFINLGGTPMTQALIEAGLLEAAGTPLVGPFTASSALRDAANPQIFYVRAGLREEVDRMVGQLMSMGMSRVGVITQANAYGKEALEFARLRLKAVPGLVVVESQVDLVEPNFKAAVKPLIEGKVQAALMFTSGRITGGLIQGYRADGGGGLIFVSSANAAEALHKAIGDAAVGVGVVQAMPSQREVANPLVARYLAAMKQHAPAGAFPSAFSLEGCVNALVTLEAIKRAKAPVTGKSVYQALTEMKRLDLGGFELRYDDKRRAGTSFARVGIIGPGGRLLN